MRDHRGMHVKELIARLDNTLQSMNWNANTKLAYNLIMLAAACDAVHLRRIMKRLFDRWIESLPFVGEEGVDIDWEGVKSKFNPLNVKENFDTSNPLFKEIKDWEEKQDDLPITKEEGKGGPDILCGLEQDRLWDTVSDDYIFCNDEMKDMAVELKRLLLLMSSYEQEEVERLLVYELYRIQLLADNLKALLRTPSQVISNKEKRDELISKFFEHVRLKCTVKVERVKSEFLTWLETYQDSLTLELLTKKMERYRKKLEDSGFLDDVVKLYRHSDDANKHVNRFFDDKGLKKNFVGFYIYTKQLKYPDWKKKTEQFFIFAEVKLLIDAEIEKLGGEKDKPKEKEVFNTKNGLVARSILQLMEEKAGKSGLLFRQYNQWIAVHRVLSNYYGFSDSYQEFCKQMEDLHLGDISYPCTLDGLKKAALPILYKPFDKWEEYQANENPKTPAFVRQYQVAVRLLEILEENKVEKAVKK